MTPSAAARREMDPKVGNSFVDGVLFAGLVSPGVHGFNRVFMAVSSFSPEQIASMKFPSIEASRRIYSGVFDNPKAPGIPTFLNFIKPGYKAYAGRELLRCGFKPVGAQIVVPKLNEYFDVKNHSENKGIVAVLFAAFMSVCDGALSPADGIRTREQAGLSWVPTVEEAAGRNRLLMLSQGGDVNVLRQFAIWNTWYLTKDPAQKITREVFKLDPEEPSGISAQSTLQAPPITGASVLIEKVKNFMIVNPNAHIGKGNIYVTALRGVINPAIWSGAIPKTGSIFFLLIGFNGVGALPAMRAKKA